MKLKKCKKLMDRTIALILAGVMVILTLHTGSGLTVLADTGSDNSSLAGLEEFPLSAVKVTDDYYENVTQKDIDFLLTFDMDRLLSRYREIAGLSTQGKNPYKGWETTQIAGHTLGHYLTASAQAFQSAANAEDRNRIEANLKYLIDELLKCQNSTSGRGYQPGFVFGTIIDDPNNKEYQFDVVEGKIDGSHWVPWYNMHKLMTGIVCTYKNLGYEPAKTLGSVLGDWAYNRASKWDAETHAKVLNIEFGGMNDCLYELYKITGKQTHLEVAHKFDHESLFGTVAAGTTNVLNGHHANTTIPKYVGAINRYQTLKDSMPAEAERYLEYCEKFWDMVIDRHTYVTGANSQWEHFRDDYILDGQRTQCNNETCNVHNMLLLSRELFKITGEKKYADYYETAFINSIMASVNPEDASTTYFQPMATGYYKVYSNPDVNENLWWCCTGTGLENFTKLGDSIYFHKDNVLVVNQYLSSELDWNDKGIKLVQETTLPDSDVSNFTVGLTKSASLNFTLALRLPEWLAGDAVIKVNGQNYPADIADGYAMVNRSWKNGDQVSIQLPMEIVAHGLPDNQNAYSFKYGPVVLAAELGSDELMEKRSSCGWWVALPENKRVGTDKANPADGQRSILKSETLILKDQSVDFYTKNINNFLVKGDGLNFTLNGTKLTTTGETLTFSPYYSLHGQRYGVYWYFSGVGDDPDYDVIMSQKEDGRDGRTKIDGLRAGYRVQDEEDVVHWIQDNAGKASTGNQADPDLNLPSRYANANGFFTYHMVVDKENENYLVMQLAKADNGKALRITSGNTELFYERLNYVGENDLYKIRVPIPASVAASSELIVVSASGQTKAVRVVPITFTGADGEASARLVGEQSVNIGYSANASVTSIVPDIGTVTATEDAYSVLLPSGTKEAELQINIADSFGLLYIDDVLVNDDLPQKITLDNSEKICKLKVYAEDHTTFKEYTLTVKEDVRMIKELNIFKYFSFDNTLSDAVLVSKSGNPQPTSDTPTYADGKYGKAIQLPGNSYGLRLGATAGWGESYTVAWWMKPTSIKGQYDPLFTAGTFSPEYWISATFDAKVWSNDGTKRSMPSANAYKAGQWQYVTVVVQENPSGSGLSKGWLYLNGEMISSGEVARGIMQRTNGQAYFGVNAWDAYFDGAVDDLILLKGTLNEMEIKAMMERFLSPDKAENDQNMAQAVQEKIESVASVEYTPEFRTLLASIRADYDSLTADQKALVTNLNKLKEAEDSIAQMEAAWNIAQAQSVEERIHNIGAVKYTPEFKTLLDSAREAYENLTQSQKELVTNLDKLRQAEEGYQRLEDEYNLPMAREVENKINAIGPVEFTAEFKKLLDSAKQAYENLTPAQKALVTNLEKLAQADEGYRRLGFNSVEQSRSLLQKEINQIRKLKPADYTAESWKAVEIALETANKALASLDVTKQELDTALAALRAAVKNLKQVTKKVNAIIQLSKLNYDKTFGAKAFSLGASSNAALTYISSDNKVVTVSKNGIVTVKGCGTAIVTILASGTNFNAAVKTVKITVKPKKAVIKKLSVKAGNQLIVKWKKDSKATGCQIQYSTSRKFKKSKTKLKTVKKTKTIRKTFKGLKRGKKYYVKVRAYKKYGKSKIYGAWSKVRTKKMK